MSRTLELFKEICAIPHGSYNVDAISDYLVDFAKKNNLIYRQDEEKNVIIRKKAYTGYENLPGVIIQGHMDMVAVKTEECTLDLEKDGLIVKEEDGYLFAEGTSLGGDDGIAVAYALAILEDENIKHPELECIFTVNEEVGLLGAQVIDLSDIKGKYLINIDSEEEGVITTSCAGGVVLSSLLRLDRDLDMYGTLYSVNMKGFKGGHSGTAIHEGRANASHVMGRFLKDIEKKGKINILDLQSGEKDNAIPNFAKAIFATDLDEESFKKTVLDFDSLINEEYKGRDNEIEIVVTPLDYSNEDKKLIGDKSSVIIDILNFVPDGVVSMCDGIDMVKTSLNLGITKIDQDGLKLEFCLRSSSKEEKEALKEKLGTILIKKGCELALSGDYPGWDYNSDSMLQKITVESYKELYKEEPLVTGVHAGLECGILLDKKSDLDCISIGPNILNIHTTDEKLDLASTERTWNLIVKILENIK